MPVEHTGERLLREHYAATAEDHLIRLFHEVTWSWAGARLEGKRVLDFGCGGGEGTAAMAAQAASALGVDVADEAVTYARERNGGPNIDYEVIADGVPRLDASFDAVCSFQVLEHVADPGAYLAEAKRLVAPGGELLLATPDRRTRLLRRQRPWNRWHLREWDPDGLARLLGRHFGHVEVLTMSGRRDVLDLELRRHAPPALAHAAADAAGDARARPRRGAGGAVPAQDLARGEWPAGGRLRLRRVGPDDRAGGLAVGQPGRDRALARHDQLGEQAQRHQLDGDDGEEHADDQRRPLPDAAAGELHDEHPQQQQPADQAEAMPSPPKRWNGRPV